MAFDWLRRALGVSPQPPRPSPSVGIRAVGGRVSLDDPATRLTASRVIIAPDDHESDWRLLDLDAATLARTSPIKLLEYLADLSPPVSRALWDFQRLCNPGYELRALRPGGDEIDARATAVVGGFIERLESYYGTMDVVFGRIFLAQYLRGAALGELVLDERGREMVDLATPDPSVIRFERVHDPLRGHIWLLGQWQGGRWVRLDHETIRYIPVDPLPGKPYGRAPAHPSLFAAMFLLGLLHDLRRVIAQQGYPRIDIAVVVERLRAMMPTDARMNADAQQRWIDEAISQIKASYATLEPDDAYIHTDVIEVNRPVGTVDSGSLGAVDGLIESLERMLVQALKTMPLMMGITDGVSEANANRQWEIQVAGIKSMQHRAETLVSRLLTLGLRAQGIQARAELRFAELRAAEEMRDAQTEQIRIANAESKVRNRWITNDEAAMAIASHAAVDPSYVPDGGDVTDTSTDDPDPGASRMGRRALVRAIVGGMERENITPDGEPLDPPESGAVEITEGDRQAILDSWDDRMEEYETLLDAAVEESAEQSRATMDAVAAAVEKLGQVVADRDPPVVNVTVVPRETPAAPSRTVTRKAVERDEKGRAVAIVETTEPQETEVD